MGLSRISVAFAANLFVILTTATPLFAANTAAETNAGCMDPVLERQRILKFAHLPAGKIPGTPGSDATSTQRHPWPFPLLSIGHTNASYQYYGGEPYFHHGLDIRGDAGTPVVASAGGKVVNIENYMPGNPAYWEVAVLDDEGYLWQYHHVEKESIPSAIWNAWRSGAKIAPGTTIGEIYRWSVSSFGERYDHVHLNVLGTGASYLSPFMFLDELNDNSAPAIIASGVLKGGRDWGDRPVEGDYSIHATIHDLILHDKYVVPPHRVEVAIDGGTPEVVWDFQTLPDPTTPERHVEELFVPDMTCGNYTCRRLTIDIGFVKDGRRRFPDKPGRHEARIIARDFAGNTAEGTVQWTVAEKTNSSQ
ncbi:MAG: hypothetical protein RIQ81_1113 [Pseudomonadota bacterium]|jgi:hypothetical protein